MKKSLLYLFLFLPFFAVSQESDLGNWLIYLGNKKISQKWDIHHEVQYRNYNAIGDLEQLLLRTGLGYNLTEGNNNVLLGYGYILSQNYQPGQDDKVSIEEHRIFQQFITKQRFGRVNLLHRYRFEQRWVEDNDIRFRYRYFLAVNIALSKPTNTDNTLYFSAYNEIFINGDGVLFDRNRLYFGLGYKLNQLARFEIGYMNQFLNATGRDQINLITFLTF